MKSDRWRRVQELFEGAADLRPPEQAAYLSTACAADENLRREVEALLRSDAAAGSFIEHAIRRGSDLLLAAEADPLESMGKIGKYEILERIGEGGFGVVYKGRDAVLQRYVAVKTCSSKDEKLRRRFFREGQIAAGLQHPNITTVHDLGVESGVPYLVQEFLDGEDLHRKIRRREALTPVQRLDILAQVARGLEYAHLQGVLHRDIKPANIRVLPGGGVKIMDFGIAKLLHDVSDVTTQGVTLGTVGYLAPEQLRGEEVDRRTDIFSFGVLVYELLTYERPFKGSTFSEVSYRLLNEEPRALIDLAPTYSSAIAALADRCLAKDPQRRYESVGEVIAVLEPEIEALRSGVFVVPVAVSADAGKAAIAGAGAATAAPPLDAMPATAARQGDAPAAPGCLTGTRPSARGRGLVPPIGAARLAAALAVVAATLGLGGWALVRFQQAGTVAAAESSAGAWAGSGRATAGRSAAAPANPQQVGPGRQVSGDGGAPRLGGKAGGLPGAPGGAQASEAARLVAAAQGEAAAIPAGGPPGPNPSAAPGQTAVARGPRQEGRASSPAPSLRQPAASRRDPEARAAGAPAESRGDAGASPDRHNATLAVERSAPAARAGSQGSPPATTEGVEVEAESAGAAGEGSKRAAASSEDLAIDGSADGTGQPAGGGGAIKPMAPGDLILPGTPGVVPPRLVSRPEPQYPDRARRRRAEADVMMLVLVDETGHVIRAIIKRTDDPGLGFNESARQAALRATFSAATRDGLPGKIWTELPFSFRFPN